MPKLKMKPTAELTLDSGEVVQVERIGKGRYTIAWRNSHNVYLQTHEKDFSKELLARIADNPHLPVVTEHGYFDGNSPFKLYSEPLYMPLTAKAGKAWEDFKLLKGLRDEAERESRASKGWNQRTSPDEDARSLNQLLEDKVSDATYLPERLKDAVALLVQACSNYGAYCIEITKKNCAIDGKGNLILLDPCFDLAEVRKSREDAHKRHRGY